MTAGSGPEEALAFLVDVEVGCRPGQGEGLELFEQEWRDGPVAVPLAITGMTYQGAASMLQRSRAVLYAFW